MASPRSARYKGPEGDAAARSGRRARRRSVPRSPAGCRSRRDSGSSPSDRRYWNDHLFLDDKAFDPADEEGAVGMQPLGFGRGVGPLHRCTVVVPEFGDAVDFDVSRRDVGPGPLVEDVRLHIAPQPRHGVGQGAMHLEPMLDEVLVAEAVLAGQQPDALDHFISPFGRRPTNPIARILITDDDTVRKRGQRARIDPMDLKLVREEAIEGTNRALWDKHGFVPDPDSEEFEEEYRRQFELAKTRLALTHPTAPAVGAHAAPPPDPTNWAELTGEATQIRWAAALRAERVREIRDGGIRDWLATTWIK